LEVCDPHSIFVVLDFKVNDPTKCGALRVYFDYDKDFPDDDRICEEVKELQVNSLNTKWHASNFLQLVRSSNHTVFHVFSALRISQTWMDMPLEQQEPEELEV
jgi:hypothetical protein